MKDDKKGKKFPRLESDEAAERFVETSDLSEYDFSGFRPLSSYEFESKTARVNMRIPQGQLDAVKAEAEKRGIPYQRLMRELIDRGMQSLQTQ